MGLGILADTRRLILYNVMCFVQGAQVDINPWVIKADVFRVTKYKVIPIFRISKGNRYWFEKVRVKRIRVFDYERETAVICAVFFFCLHLYIYCLLEEYVETLAHYWYWA